MGGEQGDKGEATKAWKRDQEEDEVGDGDPGVPACPPSCPPCSILDDFGFFPAGLACLPANSPEDTRTLGRGALGALCRSPV